MLFYTNVYCLIVYNLRLYNLFYRNVSILSGMKYNGCVEKFLKYFTLHATLFNLFCIYSELFYLV